MQRTPLSLFNRTLMNDLRFYTMWLDETQCGQHEQKHKQPN